MFEYKSSEMTQEEKEEQRRELREKCKTAMYVCGAIIMVNAAVHSFSNPNKNNALTNTDAFLWWIINNENQILI